MRVWILCAAFLIFSSIVNVPTKEKYEVSVVAIFQSEARFLKEWIEFHKTVGVQHFYLYNNLSTDNYAEVLAPYVEEGLVEVIDWPYKSQKIEDWNTIQCKAYMDGIERTKKVSKWVAFIDTDEFLFPLQTNNLALFLKDYEEYAAVGVNWQCYGTSNIPRILPSEFMIERLIFRAPTLAANNYHIKSIVQPKRVVDCSNPHFFKYKHQYAAVNESKKELKGPKSEEVEIKKIRINHYWSRDLDFLLNDKLARQNKWVHKTKDQVLANDQDFNVIEDRSIFPYLEKMKKRLKNFNDLPEYNLSPVLAY